MSDSTAMTETCFVMAFITVVVLLCLFGFLFFLLFRLGLDVLHSSIVL